MRKLLTATALVASLLASTIAHAGPSATDLKNAAAVTTSIMVYQRKCNAPQTANMYKLFLALGKDLIRAPNHEQLVDDALDQIISSIKNEGIDTWCDNFQANVASLPIK